VLVPARSHLGRVSEAGLVALVGSHLWFADLQPAAMFEKHGYSVGKRRWTVADGLNLPARQLGPAKKWWAEEYRGSDRRE